MFPWLHYTCWHVGTRVWWFACFKKKKHHTNQKGTSSNIPSSCMWHNTTAENKGSEPADASSRNCTKQRNLPEKSQWFGQRSRLAYKALIVPILEWSAIPTDSLRQLRWPSNTYRVCCRKYWEKDKKNQQKMETKAQDGEVLTLGLPSGDRYL